jgi:4-hydroxy-3-methylbut-2-enyl diphosphate reductase
VREIHDEVKSLEAEGRQIIIIGDHGHDEVIGIASQVKDPKIVSSVEEAQNLRKMKKAGIVSQSTQTIENVQSIINIIMTKSFDLRFVNTICFPTKRNQTQLKSLSEITDVMIIIGSFTSANSKRLHQLALERNKKSYQVTCGEELQTIWFENAEIVGITAGASTPDSTIKEVIQKIKSFSDIHEEVIYA